MARLLLSGFRLRIGDGNFNPPEVEGLPYRLRFFDSTTSQPKTVYAGPDVGDTSLGAIVSLDAEGYVPVSGIWLDEGRYNIAVEYALIPNPLVDADWGELWIINKVQGGTFDSGADDGTIRFVETVPAIRALSGSDLGGMTLNTGYYNINDGGQGAWRWIDISLESDDGGSVLKPTGHSEITAGRWHRVFDGDAEVSVKLWGAVTGQGDVSGNIESADLYCARTSDDTGVTLAFPSGSYSIGSAVLVLDAKGLTQGANERAVQYHIHENAVFITTGEVQLLGPAVVDSTSLISSKLQLGDDNVIGGYCKPEWWGAKGDGVDDDTLEFRNCWAKGGNHAVDLVGLYKIDSNLDIVRTIAPTLHFRGSSKLVTTFDDGVIEIGKVLMDIPLLRFDGAVGAYNISNFAYRSSWFDIVSTVNFRKFCLTNNGELLHADLYWDSALVFGDFDQVITTGSMRHISTEGGEWWINDTDVRIPHALINDNHYFFKFALIENTGTIKVDDLGEYDASWFGAIGENKRFQLYHLFRNLAVWSKTTDFRHRYTGCDQVLDIVTTSDTDMTISNINMKFTTELTGGLTIGGAAGKVGTVSILGGKIEHVDDTGEFELLSLEAGYATIKGVTLVNSVVSIDTHNITFNGNVLRGNSLDIYSATTGALGQVISDNDFVDTVLNLLSSGNVLQNICISNNRFSYTTQNAGGHFIHLVPDGLLNLVLNIRVFGNNYNYALGYELVTNPPFPDDDDLMGSIVDLSNGVSTSWATDPTLDIYIADPQINSSTALVIEDDFPFANRYFNTYVEIYNTHGEFSILSDITTGSGDLFLNFDEQFKFTGREGYMVAMGLAGTAHHTVAGNHQSGRPVVVSGVNHEAYLDQLRIAYNFESGSPFSGGGWDKLLVTGKFAKLFSKLAT